jgi:hypothetical protein
MWSVGEMAWGNALAQAVQAAFSVNRAYPPRTGKEPAKRGARSARGPETIGAQSRHSARPESQSNQRDAGPAIEQS